MPKDNLVYVGHMIDLAKKARSFVEGLSREDFDSDELLRLSLTYLIQTIGESARRTAPEFRAIYPQIDWQGIVGMRSKIVHDYLNVDEDVVWDTVTNELPALIEMLQQIMDE